MAPSTAARHEPSMKKGYADGALAVCVARQRDAVSDGVAVALPILRKEVIQPQVPLRLPCYDFTPVADPTVDGCLLKG